jgi:hypothetical protein
LIILIHDVAQATAVSKTLRIGLFGGIAYTKGFLVGIQNDIWEAALEKATAAPKGELGCGIIVC